MKNASIFYRKADGKLDEIAVSERDGERYELHDGYVKYDKDRKGWNVLPMHRIDHMEEWD